VLGRLSLLKLGARYRILRRAPPPGDDPSFRVRSWVLRAYAFLCAAELASPPDGDGGVVCLCWLPPVMGLSALVWREVVLDGLHGFSAAYAGAAGKWLVPVPSKASGPPCWLSVALPGGLARGAPGFPLMDSVDRLLIQERGLRPGPAGRFVLAGIKRCSSRAFHVFTSDCIALCVGGLVAWGPISE